MVGNAKPATYFLPEAIRAGCEGWIRAEAAYEGVPDEAVETPRFHGLAGDAALVVLPHRNDLRVRAFPVQHSVPSLGYTIAFASSCDAGQRRYQTGSLLSVSLGPPLVC